MKKLNCKIKVSFSTSHGTIESMLDFQIDLDALFLFHLNLSMKIFPRMPLFDFILEVNVHVKLNARIKCLAIKWTLAKFAYFNRTFFANSVLTWQFYWIGHEGKADWALVVRSLLQLRTSLQFLNLLLTEHHNCSILHG